jgi:hypothetical protein
VSDRALSYMAALALLLVIGGAPLVAAYLLGRYQGTASVRAHLAQERRWLAECQTSRRWALDEVARAQDQAFEAEWRARYAGRGLDIARQTCGWGR